MYSSAQIEEPHNTDPVIAGFAVASVPRFIAEKHYTIQEIATLWHLSRSKVRELFLAEAGVMREGKPTRRVAGRSRRGYYMTRLPESAVLRVHRRLTGEGWYGKLAKERHYTPQQLAAAWRWSETKVRRVLRGEKGVLRVGEASRRVGRKHTRRMYTLRVPETVAQRVYDERVSKPGRAPC